MKTEKFERGQIGLLLLVILGLLITLVMSIASRTLSDTSLARQEKEQSATFTIAESGIEEALRLIKQGNTPNGASTISDSLAQITGKYTVASQSSLEIYLREGEVAHVNMVGYTGLTIPVSWTKKNIGTENIACVSEGSGNSPAALEVVLINSTTRVATRAYYNASNCGLSGNGFAGSTDGGSTFLSSAVVTVPSGTSILRIRPLYNGATVNVSGMSLPSQQYVIQSQAEGGDSQKEIEVKRTIDHPPSVFDYAVFSGTTVVK